MKRIENNLKNIGFKKLQEKEDFIYFEKSETQNKKEFKQICIVYDKKNKRLKSLDTFSISNDELRLLPNDKNFSRYISKLLTS